MIKTILYLPLTLIFGILFSIYLIILTGIYLVKKLFRKFKGENFSVIQAIKSDITNYRKKVINKINNLLTKIKNGKEKKSLRSQGHRKETSDN